MTNKQATITYNGLEDKGLTVSVIDEGGKKWTIWKKAYQSQADSEAWAELQKHKIGDRIMVEYAEKEESFVNDQGKTINFTRKTIQKIIPTVGTSRKTEGETDWDNIAVGKCQTAFLAAYLQAGNSFEDAKLKAAQARKLAEIVVYGHSQAEPAEAAAAKRLEEEMARDLEEEIPF